MKIFAHRGYHDATSPANTLAAFERAARFGVDGIETDVRVCAEGVPILFHDRCLPDGRPVASLTRPQLCAAVGYEVPTLAQALDQGWDLTWNLELKAAEALDPAIRVLEPLKTLRFLISSFSHPLVLRATDMLQVPGAFVIAHAPADADTLEKATQHVRTLVWDFETVTPELVRQARVRGFASMVYGPLTPQEHNLTFEWGIEALITDFPHLAM